MKKRRGLFALIPRGVFFGCSALEALSSDFDDPHLVCYKPEQNVSKDSNKKVSKCF